jgi:hypothetical protein
MKVIYTGTSNYRVLDAHDMHKVDEDLEFRKTTFARGEAVEVDDAVGEQLINHPLFGGDFTEAKKGTISTLGLDGPAPGEVDPKDNLNLPEHSAGTTGTVTEPTAGGTAGTTAASRSRAATTARRSTAR